MINKKCKICRRLGIKLFLKGERCFSSKCAIVKKPYSPGQQKKKKGGPLSEYGKELREKQKLKELYNLRETQFKKYVKEVLSFQGKVEDIGNLLIKKLECRLDNVIFRLGFADSRTQARQLVSHKHFLVNGKTVNIPSYQVRKGDTITIKEKSLKKPIFENLRQKLKKHKMPSWLSLNLEKLEAKVISEPSFIEVSPPVELSSVFEFYSR